MAILIVEKIESFRRCCRRKSRYKFEGTDTKEESVRSVSFFVRSGKRRASNICLVTFIIEIGFVDPFDSQIFSMNAGTERRENDYAGASSDRRAQGEGGRREKGGGGAVWLRARNVATSF